MSKNTFVETMRRVLMRFRASTRGNVMITFALATVPIIAFVGAAIDYSRGNSAKAAMQAAVDSTALMLSKEVATLTTTEMNQKAMQYFNALFHRPEVSTVVVTPTYSTDNGTQLVLNAKGMLANTFLRVIGQDYLTIDASSTVEWGNSRLRVALVLDNTGSMASAGKMDALKTATKNLLDQLQSAATQNGDVYVSVIPFVKDVNVDRSNYNANWIDWTEWDAANGSKEKNCTGSGKNKTCTTTWVPDSHSSWNGCVVDRGNSNGPSAGNYDTNVVAPTPGITATLFAAEQYSSCPQAIMPLSYDWAAMKTLVNKMSPAGNTNQAIGLMHGWMSLVGGGPYPPPPPEDPNYNYSKVIILLTDGLNTENRWYSNQNAIDARQQMTCNNINAAGITLYTIQVNTDGDPTSQLLKKCAGSPGKYPDPDKFFLLTSANDIITTFQQIGTKLSNLRVAK